MCHLNLSSPKSHMSPLAANCRLNGVDESCRETEAAHVQDVIGLRSTLAPGCQAKDWDKY